MNSQVLTEMPTEDEKSLKRWLTDTAEAVGIAHVSRVTDCTLSAVVGCAPGTSAGAVRAHWQTFSKHPWQWTEQTAYTYLQWQPPPPQLHPPALLYAQAPTSWEQWVRIMRLMPEKRLSRCVAPWRFQPTCKLTLTTVIFILFNIKTLPNCIFSALKPEKLTARRGKGYSSTVWRLNDRQWLLMQKTHYSNLNDCFGDNLK